MKLRSGKRKNRTDKMEQAGKRIIITPESLAKLRNIRLDPPPLHIGLVDRFKLLPDMNKPKPKKV